MDHDYNEPALALSDVVHDEPLPDDHQHHHLHALAVSSPSRPHSPPAPSPFQHQPSAHVSRDVPELLYSPSDERHLEHDDLSSALPTEGLPSFTIEQLEREISTFLHQNSAAILGAASAAASQRDDDGNNLGSTSNGHSPPDDPTLSDVQRDVDALAGVLGLNLSGLAAVLQAAHAQAAEEERAAEALAAADPELAQRRKDEEMEKKATRSAPAFHYPASDTVPMLSHSGSPTDGSEYYFDEEGESERGRSAGADGGQESARTTGDVGGAEWFSDAGGAGRGAEVPGREAGEIKGKYGRAVGRGLGAAGSGRTAGEGASWGRRRGRRTHVHSIDIFCNEYMVLSATSASAWA